MTDWTPDTLKDYLESHLDAIHKEITVRIDELHREHDKFEETVRDSFVKQNAFRGALDDLGRTMATRREMETLDRAMANRIETYAGQATIERNRLEDRITRSERWQSRIGGGLLIIGLIVPSLVAGLIYLVTHHH